MKSLRLCLPLLISGLLTSMLVAQPEQKAKTDPPVMQSGDQAKKANAPEVWIDAKTGHRVFRISPESGGSGHYFHDDMYTFDSNTVCINAGGSVMAIDLRELEKGVVKRDVIAKGNYSMTAPKTREVYMGGKGGSLTAVNIDTKAVREIKGASGLVNADETTTFKKTSGQDPTGKLGPRPPTQTIPQRERMFGDKIKKGIPLTADEETAAKKEQGLAGRVVPNTPNAFTFTDVKTGASKTVGHNWGDFNHMQWSPTDPDYLLYCHEGTWHELDRVWVIKRDGTGQKLVHKRTMDMEIAGHEWWGRDGKTVWYDNQTPRSQDFWLKSYNVDTGERTAFHLERNEWGIHFTSAADNKTFSSDGAGKGQVSYAPAARWIYALHGSPDPETTKKRNEVIDGKQVQFNTVKSEKLVDMTHHGYSLEPGNQEPNSQISPDGKWIVFRTNMWSTGHVLAVEVAPWKK